MNGRNKTSNRLPSKNSIRYYLILLNELIPFKRAGLLLHSFLFILVQKCFTLSCHHFRVHYQLFLSCASVAFYKGLFFICCCFSDAGVSFAIFCSHFQSFFRFSNHLRQQFLWLPLVNSQYNVFHFEVLLRLSACEDLLLSPISTFSKVKKTNHAYKIAQQQPLRASNISYLYIS